MGLVRGGKAQLMRGALCAVGVARLPLALLTGVHGDFIRPERAKFHAAGGAC